MSVSPKANPPPMTMIEGLAATLLVSRPRIKRGRLTGQNLVQDQEALVSVSQPELALDVATLTFTA